MIEKISWASYATALLTIVVIYYIVIALLYYRKEIFGFANALQQRFPFNAGLKQEVFINSKESLSQFNDAGSVSSEKPICTGDISTDSFDLVEKIKESMQRYAENEYIREEIITGLQLLLKEYPQLRYSPYTASINNTITKEIELHCSIRLEDDEVKRLWM
ncbi:MAG: hypothetical protein U0U33_16875 [Chitinophagaceae bacterium]|mgnify:CR=1 FL=1